MEKLSRLALSQAPPADLGDDFRGELCLGQQVVSVRKVQVLEHISGTFCGFSFNSSCHFDPLDSLCANWSRHLITSNSRLGVAIPDVDFFWNA